MALSASGVIVVLSTCLIISWPDITWSIRAPNAASSYRVVPEYARTMKRVVISIPINKPSISLHQEYLQSLPKYTEILILLPEDGVEAVTEELKHQPYFGRTRLIPFDTKEFQKPRVYFTFPERDKLIEAKANNSVSSMKFPWGTLWAQDLFEVGTTPDGNTLALIPSVHKWFVVGDNRNPLKVSPDNSYVGHLSSASIAAKRLPLTFAGGNVLIDE